jgi:Uma2 family endonuclease
MSTLTERSYFSPDEYLEFERYSNVRHEYQRGLVYAMAGTKKFHAQIASNFHVLLANHLAESPCSVYESDMKVKIETANCYYYPDLSVTCDKRDVETNDDFILSPKLIVEVLSKSTEKFDKTDKFLDYQQLTSLQEYVLVSQDKIQVECYRKQESGQWISQCYDIGEIVELRSICLTCAIEKIYDRVLGSVKSLSTSST